MAQKTIPQLQEATTLSANGLIPVDSGTQTFRISAGNLSKSLQQHEPVRQPGVINLVVSYAAGVFTVCAADGSALSVTNPGIVYLPSRATPGLLVKHLVTANQSFQDDAHASSEIIGNLFGASTGIAWGEDCPFFIYAVTNDAESAIAFMLSRDPRASVSPAEAAIGAPDDPVADTETSFFSFDNLDESVYDANPCLCIGAIRMRMSTSDDWTVQTLTTKDGIGKFHESTKFTFPQAQNGAASGSHILLNGGTSVPQCTIETYYYWVKRDGTVRCEIYYEGDAGTDGVGAVSFLMSLPVENRGAASIRGYPLYVVSSAAGTTVSFWENNTTSHRLYSEAGPFTLATFGNGARQISSVFLYQGFTE